MSIINAFSMPPTENAWADQSTSSYEPTWGAFNTHHTSYTSNYDFSALREASEATSMWKDDAVKDLPSAPSQKDQFRYTADKTQDAHHAEDDDEYSAWNFDAFEAALNEPTTEPPAPPQPSNQDVLNAAQSSLAADLAHRTSTLPPADPAEVARVRRLLRWMMVTDYTIIPSSPLRPTRRRAVNSITLPAADRAHFLHLAALSRRVEALHAARKKKKKKKNRTPSSCPSLSTSTSSSTTPLRNADADADADDDHDVLATYFWQSVHAPCAALGLHPSILVARCLDLAHFSGATGRYDGAERGTLALFGVGAWARRLFVDRALVLPVVFTADADHDDDDAAAVQAFAADGGGDAGRVDAAVVWEAIERRARVWFERVEGLEGLVVERGPEEGRWLFTDVCRFRLNERGKKLDARRSRGASGFGKGLCASAADRRRAVDGAVKSLEGKVLHVVGRVKDPRVDPDAAVCVPLLSRFI
ncbi:hypothetical protein DIS24_g4391 [Lasiodiplodia hormozganensis]|uniref:Uncharacterized protein n=1 Tax=Lasiodiplodia hormozganensis TaxID=869390 RepID=A0AA40D0T3_9PEZI|nr:hypothetical protein DIS24_g4391 [Lasiodiplodia hormozganensis]